MYLAAAEAAIFMHNVGRIATLGVGLLLIWTAMLRGWNSLHVALGQRLAWFPPPARVYAPIPHGGERAALLGGLAAGLSPVITGISPLMGIYAAQLRYPEPVPLAIALHLFLMIEIFFLHLLSEHPRWKLLWVSVWYGFAIVAAGIAAVVR